MSVPAVLAWVGLGGNVGDVQATLDRAVELIGKLPGTSVTVESRRYRTPAWGPVRQADFVNAVCGVSTTLAPSDLMHALLGIERTLGRDRDAPGQVRWGPRAIDLDLLLYGDTVVAEAGLQVPHPRLHERAFVLVPLAEVAKGLEVPGQGPVTTLLAGLDTSAVHALP